MYVAIFLKRNKVYSAFTTYLTTGFSIESLTWEKTYHRLYTMEMLLQCYWEKAPDYQKFIKIKNQKKPTVTLAESCEASHL